MSAADISAALAARIPLLCTELLPLGHREGREWKCADLTGKPGRSLSVCLAGTRVGVWADFATGESGDPLDLVAAVKGLSLARAMRWSADWLGQSGLTKALACRLTGHHQAADEASRIKGAIALWNAAGAIDGTAAARYLQKRNILNAGLADGDDVLRFHPHCPFDGAHHPCLIVPLRDIHSDAITGIRRTALTANADKIGVLALGRKRGSVIKLSDHAHVEYGLALGEGLETTLSGVALGYGPAWATGDARELAEFPVLAGVETIMLFVDNDVPGRAAATRCAERWLAAGRAVKRVVSPVEGEDLNGFATRKLRRA
jgi:putative DNA primase/helicase